MGWRGGFARDGPRQCRFPPRQLSPPALARGSTPSSWGPWASSGHGRMGYPALQGGLSLPNHPHFWVSCSRLPAAPTSGVGWCGSNRSCWWVAEGLHLGWTLQSRDPQAMRLSRDLHLTTITLLHGPSEALSSASHHAWPRQPVVLSTLWPGHVLKQL